MHRTTLTRVPTPRSLAMASACAAVLVSAACAGDSTSPRSTAATQLSFAAMTSTGASGDVAAAALTAGTHTLDLTNISLTIARAELKLATTDVCLGDNEDVNDDHPARHDDNDRCEELEVGPRTIDLAVNGDAASVPTAGVPAGSYRELELRLNTVGLKGTFDGKAFDITLPLSAKGEIEFDPPLVVSDSSPANLTVNLPLATWFTNTDGSLVDPNLLATTPALAAQVKARILASLRAIEDRNHDGHDDHGRDGHGGHGDNSGPGNGDDHGGNSGSGNGGSGNSGSGHGGSGHDGN